jgi:hypothetical protein
MVRSSRAPHQERVPRCEVSGMDRRLVTFYRISGQISSGFSGHCPTSQDISLKEWAIPLQTWLEEDHRI